MFELNFNRLVNAEWKYILQRLIMYIIKLKYQLATCSCTTSQTVWVNRIALRGSVYEEVFSQQVDPSIS